MMEYLLFLSGAIYGGVTMYLSGLGLKKKPTTEMTVNITVMKGDAPTVLDAVETAMREAAARLPYGSQSTPRQTEAL